MAASANDGNAEVRSLLDPRSMDPAGELLDVRDLPQDEVDQVVAVLEAMNGWRDLERSLSEEARRYMRLGETDMRALRYLIAAHRQGVPTTPGMVARHLGLSAAAATKLTDRLEAGGHIRRRAHPEDRRRTVLEVTESTAASARASIGRSHAQRFRAVAALTPDDRASVLRFFAALSASSEQAEPD